MENRQAILDGLLADYNGAKVLYAKDVAKELGKPSAAAARALMNSPGCPLPVKQVGGRPAVTVFDMATWLAGEPISSIEVPAPQASGSPSSTSDKPVHSTMSPAKRPPRESLGKYLTLLRTQRQFLEELYVELDAMAIASEAKEEGLPLRPTMETRTDTI